MSSCFYCPQPAKYRASLVVRPTDDAPPILHTPKYVCALHRILIDRLPTVAVQKRIEAEYRAAKMPVPDWALTQLVFEPMDPTA